MSVVVLILAVALRPLLTLVSGVACFAPEGLGGMGQPYWRSCACCLISVLGKRGGC